MSVADKVELVTGATEPYGLNESLAAVGLAKSSWSYHQQQKVSYSQKYAHLRWILEEIVQAHPAYGSLRITKELQDVYQQRVNHKVVERLLQEWALCTTTIPSDVIPAWGICHRWPISNSMGLIGKVLCCC